MEPKSIFLRGGGGAFYLKSRAEQAVKAELESPRDSSNGGFHTDNCGLLHQSKLPAQDNSAGTAQDWGVCDIQKYIMERS